ncbi:hypothetical protein [Salinimicrobium sp. HB62]|uniref:hypothetical protein n=1 Tax=Salinimicrobium sp. HB62 TaxID=3077781 RepID=UPI002D77D20F|nr:hypothetical protein [Salinimicrobium sp. HB62]
MSIAHQVYGDKLKKLSASYSTGSSSYILLQKNYKRHNSSKVMPSKIVILEIYFSHSYFSMLEKSGTTIPASEGVGNWDKRGSGRIRPGRKPEALELKAKPLL